MPNEMNGFHDDMLNYFTSMTYDELQDNYNEVMDGFHAEPLVKSLARHYSAPQMTFEITYTQKAYEDSGNLLMPGEERSALSEIWPHVYNDQNNINVYSNATGSAGRGRDWAA